MCDRETGTCMCHGRLRSSAGKNVIGASSFIYFHSLTAKFNNFVDDQALEVIVDSTMKESLI